MTSSVELVRIALLALVTGVALPLLVQLFLTLRALRVAAEGIEKRMERILDDVSALADGVKARATAPSALGATLAAAVPAVVAAVQTFRTSFHGDATPSGAREDQPTPDRPDKERAHERRKM